MVWRNINSEQELLQEINNPAVRIGGGSQVPKTGNRPSLAHRGEPQPHKYHVADKPDRTYNGVVYHSKKEMLKAQELDLQVRAGDLTFWLRQVPFLLDGSDKYVADFVTFKAWWVSGPPSDRTHSWNINVLEIKGFWTPLARNKFKRFKKQYPNLKVEVV